MFWPVEFRAAAAFGVHVVLPALSGVPCGDVDDASL
jgi:hypothetical protein